MCDVPGSRQGLTILFSESERRCEGRTCLSNRSATLLLTGEIMNSISRKWSKSAVTSHLWPRHYSFEWSKDSFLLVRCYFMRGRYYSISKREYGNLWKLEKENQTCTLVPVNISINSQNLTQTHPLPVAAALSINPFIMRRNYSMTNVSRCSLCTRLQSEYTNGPHVPSLLFSQSHLCQCQKW